MWHKWRQIQPKKHILLKMITNGIAILVPRYCVICQWCLKLKLSMCSPTQWAANVPHPRTTSKGNRNIDKQRVPNKKHNLSNSSIGTFVHYTVSADDLTHGFRMQLSLGSLPDNTEKQTYSIILRYWLSSHKLSQSHARRLSHKRLLDGIWNWTKLCSDPV